ncbi:MAG: alpha/beta fold hydrolase, partial [Candidatus Acidiferrales bacterium]
RFTFARTEGCAAEAIGTLIRNGQLDPEKTALVGHSLGGAIAIRMADQFPTAATIAISPAPLVLPHRMPSNLLIFTAQFDIPILKDAAHQIALAAQGNRTDDSDFSERRAFELVRVAYATHTTLIVDKRVRKVSSEWIDRSLSSSAAGTVGAWSVTFPGSHQFRGLGGSVGECAEAGALIGFFGLLLIFPITASALVTALRPGDAPAGTTTEPRGSAQLAQPVANKFILEWAVAAFISVCVMTIAVPLHPIVRLYSGDYLASLLLLSAAILWVLNWDLFKSAANFDARSIGSGFVLGFATLLAFGAWLTLQLFDAWLNGPRWWRFAVMLPLLLPYFFAEEAALGPVPHPRTARAKRFGFFVALRLILWLACGFAFLATRNDQTIIIILLTIPLAAFAVLQRLGADALLRRTGCTPAAALFDAILAAWFLAAVFPLT